MQINPYLLPALIVISLAQGCSFSQSSKSSSESSSDSSGSISESSTSSLSSPSSSVTDEELYQREVTDYTSAYLSNKQFEGSSFSRGITDIATTNGITSWEQDEATLIAIGRGLKQADLPEGVYQTYKRKIAGTDALVQQIIQKGYDE